jgi:hypothetical protein
MPVCSYVSDFKSMHDDLAQFVSAVAEQQVRRPPRCRGLRFPANSRPGCRPYHFVWSQVPLTPLTPPHVLSRNFSTTPLPPPFPFHSMGAMLSIRYLSSALHSPRVRVAFMSVLNSLSPTPTITHTASMHRPTLSSGQPPESRCTLILPSLGKFPLLASW